MTKENAMNKTMQRVVGAAALLTATLLGGGTACADGPRDRARAGVSDAARPETESHRKPGAAAGAGETAPAKAPRPTPEAQSDLPAAAGVVNINEASAEQLTWLPGVGPSRADAIVAYRKSHPFKRPEELTRVKGIGKKTFARLRPLLALSGPTTLSERPRAQARAQARAQERRAHSVL